jgi:excisionase family DNA binding protein
MQPQPFQTNPVRFEPLVGLATAARALQLHPDTVKRKTRAGEIPGMKVGRCWKYRLSHLNAWVRSQSPSYLLNLRPIVVNSRYPSPSSARGGLKNANPRN